MQHSERGGVSAAPRSASVSVRGRWTTHTWSSASTATPAPCPISQRFGSGLGQKGSTSNLGRAPSGGRRWARTRPASPSRTTGRATVAPARTPRLIPAPRLLNGELAQHPAGAPAVAQGAPLVHHTNAVHPDTVEPHGRGVEPARPRRQI